MHRYDQCDIVGGTANGTLIKAKNKDTGELRIIEEVKRTSESWQDCMSLREIRVMRELSHANIVGLREIIREKDSMFLVFDYFECNLLEWWNEKRASENGIRTIITQIALALSHCHSKQIAHKNLSLECIYLNKKAFLKLANFTHAEFVKEKLVPQTYDSAINKWYRPPEYFIQYPANPLKGDIWALGCIMAELFLLRPLIPGLSEEDQLDRIEKLFGKQQPLLHSISKRNPTPSAFNVNNPQINKVLQDIPKEAFDLIMRMLLVDPEERMTIKQVLAHPYLSEVDVPKFNTFQPEEVLLRQLQDQIKEEQKEELGKLNLSPSTKCITGESSPTSSSPSQGRHHKKAHSCSQPSSLFPIKNSSPSQRSHVNSPRVQSSFGSQKPHSPNSSPFSSQAQKSGLIIDSLSLDHTHTNSPSTKPAKRSSMPIPSSPSKDNSLFIK